jgi:hypothetical protein
MSVRSIKKSEFPGMNGSSWGKKCLERHAAIQAHFGLNGKKATRQQRKAFSRLNRKVA